MPTPMLLRIDISRTPNALMSVVAVSAASEMNVNIRQAGRIGESRNAVLPLGLGPGAVVTKATITATAVTVTTWANRTAG